MTKVRKLKQEINLLCNKMLHNLNKGELNEKTQKTYRELVKL